MKREVDYLIRLGEDDRYRHKHIREKGKIVYFSIQLETKLGNKWQPIVRYDTSHGFAHRDLMTKAGNIIKTPIFIHDFADALTFAESDLKANWDVYKKRFLGE